MRTDQETAIKFSSMMFVFVNRTGARTIKEYAPQQQGLNGIVERAVQSVRIPEEQQWDTDNLEWITVVPWRRCRQGGW